MDQQCSKMAKVNNAEIIAVMHHSLVDHSKLINQDYTIQNSEEIVKLFADCDIRVCLLVTFICRILKLPKLMIK